MSNNDVIEATAALKGMLGIGKTISTNDDTREDPSSALNEDESSNKPEASSSDAREPKSLSSKKKKMKKKKRNSQNTGPHNLQTVNHSSSSSHTASKSNQTHKQQQNSQHQNQTHNLNRGDRRNMKTKKSNFIQHQSPGSNASVSSKAAKKKENSNFAWSAFQSPPDASSLPLPAFSGTDIFSDSQSPGKSPQPSHEKLDDSPIVDLNIMAKSVEQLENEVIAAAEAAAASKRVESMSSSISNSSTHPPQSKQAHNKEQELKEQNIKEQYPTKEQQKVKSEQTVREQEHIIPKSEGRDQSTSMTHEGREGSSEPKSQSGVNLAALTSSNQQLSQNQQSVPPPSTHDVSFSALMNAAKTKQMYNYNQQIQPPLQLTPQNPNPFSNPQHHQQHFSPQQRHQIVTIQVQVPGVFLPGRRMMVHTPAGYPIPVAVPENISPGMIIPVNVPAPLNFHPHHPPPHVGPSPPHMRAHQQNHNQQMNQFHYPNLNVPHQRQHLHVTPFNLGQDPYYPNPSNHPKPSPQNDPTSKNK